MFIEEIEKAAVHNIICIIHNIIYQLGFVNTLSKQ